jgi:hypothetical protein
MQGTGEGRVVVAYPDSELSIMTADVVGGDGNYQVIKSVG